MAGVRREFDISKELWREYDFSGRIYRIEKPVTLVFWYRPWNEVPNVGLSHQGDAHRVVDADGIVHCVPRPGIDGCVVRWENKDKANPVNF